MRRYFEVLAWRRLNFQTAKGDYFCRRRPADTFLRSVRCRRDDGGKIRRIIQAVVIDIIYDVAAQQILLAIVFVFVFFLFTQAEIY